MINFFSCRRRDLYVWSRPTDAVAKMSCTGSVLKISDNGLILYAILISSNPNAFSIPAQQTSAGMLSGYGSHNNRTITITISESGDYQGQYVTCTITATK